MAGTEDVETVVGELPLEKTAGLSFRLGDDQCG
jgi:hypothetical protein